VSWFLYQAVDAGYCRWADLSNGTYTIRDVLDMNELIAEKAEYERRAIEAAESKAGRR
jgi:hypothetical protein